MNESTDISIVDCRHRFYRTTLQIASNKGHKKIVEKSLDKDAVVNTKSEDYGIALIAAAKSGHEMIAGKLLLEPECRYSKTEDLVPR